MYTFFGTRQKVFYTFKTSHQHISINQLYLCFICSDKLSVWSNAHREELVYESGAHGDWSEAVLCSCVVFIEIFKVFGGPQNALLMCLVPVSARHFATVDCC